MKKAVLFWALLLGWMALITLGAPEEATQGMVQKIFYFHVPHALGMYLCFLVGAGASLLYLKRRDPLVDHIAVTGVELGLVLCAVVLTTGPIWAKPVWGVYWTWEPRLTTTLILWLIFMAALLSRTAFSTPERGRLTFSILSALGALNIPLVHLSVRLWRGVHPTVLRNPDGLSSAMRVYFLLSVAILLVLLIIAFLARLNARRRSSQPWSAHAPR